MVRAKFTLTDKKPTGYGEQHQLRFFTQYSPEIPEDRAFNKSTPNGTIEMTVDNPAALEQMIVGRAYYLDFSEVPNP